MFVVRVLKETLTCSNFHPSYIVETTLVNSSSWHCNTRSSLKILDRRLSVAVCPPAMMAIDGSLL
uniref:Uncharacterized protein n=1 Tax=Romanomermis culicivorax TaxID=13658 RepID=A0A915KL35_ROMCU